MIKSCRTNPSAVLKLYGLSFPCWGRFFWARKNPPVRVGFGSGDLQPVPMRTMRGEAASGVISPGAAGFTPAAFFRRYRNQRGLRRFVIRG